MLERVSTSAVVGHGGYSGAVAPFFFPALKNIQGYISHMCWKEKQDEKSGGMSSLFHWSLKKSGERRDRLSKNKSWLFIQDNRFLLRSGHIRLLISFIMTWLRDALRCARQLLQPFSFWQGSLCVSICIYNSFLKRFPYNTSGEGFQIC